MKMEMKMKNISRIYDINVGTRNRNMDRNIVNIRNF